MKFLFRWLFRFLILCIVLLVAFLLLKDMIAKSWVEREITQRTGLTVSIGKMDTGLFSSTIRAESVKLFNRPEFGGAVMMDVPELFVECDWSFSGKITPKVIRLRIKELNLVRNTQQQINLPWIIAALKPGAMPSYKNDPFPFGTSQMYVTWETISWTDQSNPSRSWRRSVNWKEYPLGSAQSSTEAGLRLQQMLQSVFPPGFTP